MKAAWSVLAGAALFAVAGGCKDRPATTTQSAASRPAPPRVELAIGRGDEDWGAIVLELDPEGTPITTRNFLRYVEEGYYDGTIFHRVIADRLIQGGSYSAPGVEKPGRHEPIRNEALTGGLNKAGTLGMARSEDLHSATSGFYINVVDNRHGLDPAVNQDGYTVFGKVVAGMEVVERIRNLEVQPNPVGREKSLPVDPPVLRKARVIK